MTSHPSPAMPPDRQRLLGHRTLQRLLVVLVASIIVWGISTCQRRRSSQQSAHHSTAQLSDSDSLPPLRIAADLAPHSFGIDDSGAISGLQPMLVREVIGDHPIEWLPVSSRHEAFELLRSGAANLYASAYPLSDTDTLSQLGLAATVPLFSASQVLIRSTHALPPIELHTPDTVAYIAIAADDLAGRIALTNAIDLAYPNLHELPISDIATEIPMGLLTRQYDYAVTSRELAEAMALQFPNQIVIVHDLSFEAQQVWIVRADDHRLRAQLNSIIAQYLSQQAPQQQSTR